MQRHAYPSAQVWLFSHVQLFAILWIAACQAPLSMGLFRQEYWSGLPLLPLEDFLNPDTEFTTPVSPALAGGFFVSQQLGIWLKDIRRQALYRYGRNENCRTWSGKFQYIDVRPWKRWQKNIRKDVKGRSPPYKILGVVWLMWNRKLNTWVTKFMDTFILSREISMAWLRTPNTVCL